MITEVALLNVKLGQSAEFTDAMRAAYPIIAQQKGFQSMEVLPAIEREDQFLLLVRWNDIESHKIGFRDSEDYQKWRELLHHFYDPMPRVEYYEDSILNV